MVFFLRILSLSLGIVSLQSVGYGCISHQKSDEPVVRITQVKLSEVAELLQKFNPEPSGHAEDHLFNMHERIQSIMQSLSFRNEGRGNEIRYINPYGDRWPLEKENIAFFAKSFAHYQRNESELYSMLTLLKPLFETIETHKSISPDPDLMKGCGKNFAQSDAEAGKQTPHQEPVLEVSYSVRSMGEASHSYAQQQDCNEIEFKEDEHKLIPKLESLPSSEALRISLKFQTQQELQAHTLGFIRHHLGEMFDSLNKVYSLFADSRIIRWKPYLCSQMKFDAHGHMEKRKDCKGPTLRLVRQQLKPLLNGLQNLVERYEE